jgi:F0F1-type ATP synthase membrane subunit a
MVYLLAAADPMEHVLPHRLTSFELGGYEVVVTNQMLMAAVAAGLMVLIFPVLFRKANTDAPRGARNFFEAILSFLRDEVVRPALRENTDRFMPFLWSLFFFILFCNLLGQIPIAEIVGLVTGKTSHLGGTATGNVYTTGVLALCTFAVIHLSGMLQVARNLVAGTYGHHHTSEQSHGKADAVGVGDPHMASHDGHALAAHPGHGMNPAIAFPLAPFLYLWNFAPHPFAPKEGEPGTMWLLDVPMFVMLLVLELIGAVIKPFALMIRLFANMIAGHLVLAVLIGLITLMPTVLGQIGVGIPVTLLALLIRVLELFVAFLQAYIFTFLATLFIAGAVAPEH